MCAKEQFKTGTAKPESPIMGLEGLNHVMRCQVDLRRGEMARD